MRLALFFGLLAMINTCHEKEEPQPITCYFGDPCINERIREMQKEPIGNTKASVWIIFTDNEYYYYVSGQCCDRPNELLDSECRVICTDQGSATARTQLTQQCSEVAGEVRRSLVWEDTRQ